MLKVSTTNASFVNEVSASKAVEGAARDRVIGRVPAAQRPAGEIERLDAERAGRRRRVPPPAWGRCTRPSRRADHRRSAHPAAVGHADDPSAPAGPQRAAWVTTARRVGIIDTGIDGSHPDIAPELRRRLSPQLHRRHPAHRRPLRGSPVVRRSRPTSTRTATAPTWPAPSAPPCNGIGIEGVAPGVDLVNVRAGQDSGYFFIEPVVDAMTYAGDIGLDVVNMSFYIDPWLYNCRAQPGRLARGPDRAAHDHHGHRSGRSTTRTARASR